MGAHGQRTLILHLPNPESLRVLATEGLPLESIPDEDLRELFVWVMSQFFRGGMDKAPSVTAILDQYEDLLSDREIDLSQEPEDSIEWAIDDLKGSYVFRQVSDFNKRFSVAVGDAENTERMNVVDQYATELVALAIEVSNQEQRVDLRSGLSMRVREYEARALDTDRVYGMKFGLPEIDSYTRGIHPGELALLAAGAKVGKSWFLDYVAFREWKRGRKVMLYTMENSVEDTQDRIACLATQVPYRDWQHGTCTDEQKAKVEDWMKEEVEQSENPLLIIQPPPGQRNVETMVRQAQLMRADSLLIDQLTYLEPRDEHQARHLQIREILHTLRGMISTGRHRLPVLLAHQINREGIKLADKANRLEMIHLAEGSESERTADWVFGLYRSKAEMVRTHARLQTLAARRERPEHFDLFWDVGGGTVAVTGTVNLD